MGEADNYLDSRKIEDFEAIFALKAEECDFKNVLENIDNIVKYTLHLNHRKIFLKIR